MASQSSPLEGIKMVLGNLLKRRKDQKLLESLQDKARKNPQNYRVQVQLGNLLTKLGKKEEAIEVYRGVAERYAQNGFLPEAVALSKIILRLDPSQSEVHQKVLDLYHQWEVVRENKIKLKDVPET